MAVCVRPSKTVSVSLEVVKEVNSDADSVWQFFNDFGSLHKWVPAIAECELEGETPNNTVGAKRVLTTVDGKQIRETLVDYQPDAHTLAYTIPGDDLGVRNYKAVMTVTDKNYCEGNSQFTWSATFEAVKGYEDKTKEMVKGLFDSAGDVLVKHFE